MGSCGRAASKKCRRDQGLAVVSGRFGLDQPAQPEKLLKSYSSCMRFGCFDDNQIAQR